MERTGKSMVSLIMMSLIRNAIGGGTFDSADVSGWTDSNWKTLYMLSAGHDLAHLVGYAVNQNKLLCPDKVREAFGRQIMTAVYRYGKLNFELGELRAALNDAQIPFIPLKGAVVRGYYPEPWMRTSCDIDVLVHPDSIERASAVLEERLKYTPSGSTTHDVSFMTPSDVHIELHHTLIESKRAGSADEILRRVWQYSSPVGGTCEYMLDDGMFYLYHLAHMAKHVCGGGCGVRPFLDLWMLNHRAEHDGAALLELIGRSRLDKFDKAARELSEYWFGGGEPDDAALQLGDYILSSGVYGNIENRVAVCRSNKSRFRYIMSRLFIPYDSLITLYPGLKGRRVLLPFYEVRRWLRMLRRSVMSRSINELKLSCQLSDDKLADTRKLFERLELSDIVAK